jgi:hypothetical protein
VYSLLYFMTNFDADVHYIAGCPMLVSHQKQVSVLETSSMAVASAPSFSGSRLDGLFI